MSASSEVVTQHGHAASHAHPPTNTGLRNGVIGVATFLCSEMTLFGSLIFMYLYIRRAATVWPPPGFNRFDWHLATVNTVVLLSSGVTMHFAYQALRKGHTSTTIKLIIITIVLGVTFLSGQVYEYKNVQAGLSLSHNTFGATFFTLTGLHGLHVSLGVVFLLIVLFNTIKGRYTKENDIVVNAATLYWHFVDAVWVVLFALFYLTA